MTVWLPLARAYPRHVLLFGLVAGLVCGGWAPPAAVPVALLGVVVMGRRAVSAALVVAVALGVWTGAARRDAIDHGMLPAALGERVTLRLTLVEPLQERASGELAARARVLGGRADGEPLLLRVADRSRIGRGTRADDATAAAAPEPGDVVAVHGRLDELGQYDEVQRRRGALAAVFVDELRPTGRRRGGPLGALDGVRRRAEHGLHTGVPPGIAALAAGMVLGRDDLIDRETEEAFQASGLAHLLAVSGTNVLLLATLTLAAGALFGLSLRARLALALALVALYVPLAGAGPSIQRAGVMGAAGLVAALAGRPASRAYALGLAAAVTLALNPYAAADVGWQLSFAAVVGLALWARPLKDWLTRRRAPPPLAEAAAMTIAATVATAPLLAAHFGRVSLVSLPANIVVAPVVALMMWLGMLACAAAQVGPALAAPLNAVNAPLIGFMDGVAHTAAGLPYAQVDLQVPAVLGYPIIALGWWWAKHPPPWRPVSAIAVAAALVTVLRPDAEEPPRGTTEVAFLDVGQGDATLIRRDGHAILFDTGPPRGGVVLRLREIGVDRLDVLVITHAQDDHEGAAITVIDRLRPKLIVNGGAGWPTPVQAALPAAARAAGARIVALTAGDRLRTGPLLTTVLSPPAAVARLPPTGDPNNRALVAHVESGRLDVLLPADAESTVTGALDLPRAEVLKVAHHGSEDPGLQQQLEEIRPTVAAIEVGADNRYGHPTAATLAALEVVPRVYRTDRDGTIRLHVSKVGLMRVD